MQTGWTRQVGIGIVGSLLLMILGLIVLFRGGDQSIGVTVIREVHIRLLGASVALWGYAAFVWLCCVTVRAKGYRTSLGLIGLSIVGALVIPFLPGEDQSPLEKKTAFAWIGGKHLLALFAAWVMICLAFWNSFDSQWVLDNLYIIKYDPRTKAESWDDPSGDAFLRSPGVKNFFTQDYWWPKGISGLYRPLTSLTYWVNWTVLGNADRTAGYHAVNMVVHWINASLLYALTFVLTRHWGVSVLASLLFAVHPITTESVTNIIGRADLFAALSVLAGVLVWRWCSELNDRRRVLGFILVMLIVAFGVFSKESAVAIGLIILFYDVGYRWGPALKDSLSEFRRIRLTAIGYTAGFCLLVFLPLAVGGWTWLRSGAVAKHGVVGMTNVLLGTWPSDVMPDQSFNWVEQYLRAALIVLVGLLFWIHCVARSTATRASAIFAVPLALLTGALLIPENRLTLLVASGVGLLIAALAVIVNRDTSEGPSWIAVGGVFLAAMSACFFVFWAGFLLSFVVGLIELVRGSLLPRVLRDSELWNRVVQRFVVGYYLLLPPVIAMLFVRYWIFNIVSTPPETPFLDNPLRGGPFDPLPLWQSRLTAVKVIGKFIYLLFWPVTLSSDYSWDQIPFFTWRIWQWENLKTLVALAVILWLIVFAWRNVQRNKPLYFFIMFFFAALLPTSNLLTLIGSIMAERFLYLPLIGFAAAVAVVSVPLLSRAGEWLEAVLSRSARRDQDAPDVSRFSLRSVLLMGFPSILLTLLTARCYIRNFDWYDDVTLWEAARVVSPRSFRCYQSLAFAYYERHPRHYVDDMIAIAEQGRPIVDPLSNDRNSSRLYLHLGMYYNIKGEMLSRRDEYGNFIVTPEARPWFQKAVDVLLRGVEVDRTFNEVNRRRQLARGDKPDKIFDAGLTPVYMTLGISYTRLGMYREAFNAYNYQRQLEPENSDPYVRIALMRIDQGMLDEAAVSLIQALLLDFKRDDAWQLLAQIYGAAGNAGQTAIHRGPQGWRLNVENPLVYDHFIRAYRGFIRIFRNANRPQSAETARRVAIFRYGMPASLFDSVMVEPIQKVTPFGMESIEPQRQR